MNRKDWILSYYERFFNRHDVSAAEEYVQETYRQHNPGLADGRRALMEGFSAKFREEPDFHLEVQLVLEDGDYLAVFAKNVGADGRVKCRVVDLYRLEGGKLAEHWDILQPCGI